MAVLRVVNFGSAKGGLATVGYTIYGVDGAEIVARATSGVKEIGTSTGVYAANIDIPDYDCIVLWDTGEATPRYSTEDYQHQIANISNRTEAIEKIYNSIRNQGEFMATLMDKLGLIEKNAGLEKVHEKLSKIEDGNFRLTNIEDAFARAAKNVNVSAPGVKIPDYSVEFKEVKSLLASMDTSKSVSKLGSMFEGLSKLVARQSDKGMQDVLVRVSALVPLLSELNKKIDKISDDRKDLSVKDDILAEIDKINKLLRSLASLAQTQEQKNILIALGHKING